MEKRDSNSSERYFDFMEHEEDVARPQRKSLEGGFLFPGVWCRNTTPYIFSKRRVRTSDLIYRRRYRLNKPNMQKIHTFSVSACIAIIMAFALFVAGQSTVHAQVTNQDITDQRMVVLSHLIDTLQEHVKFLQIVTIQRLQNQVAYLEDLVEARR